MDILLGEPYEKCRADRALSNRRVLKLELAGLSTTTLLALVVLELRLVVTEQ